MHPFPLMQYDRTDGWYGASDLGDGIWRISDHSSDNMILIIGETEALLFDTGYGAGDLKGFLTMLTDKPIRVVLSHGHLDHACGNDLFPVVYGGKEDLAELHEDGVLEKRAEQRGENPKNSKGMDMWGGCPTGESIAVTEGTEFDLGGRTLRVILTPGHTAGSLCLYDDLTQTLFTGDTYVPLEYWNNMWVHLPTSRPLPEYLDGLRRLVATGAEWLVSGHGECGKLPASRISEYIILVEDVIAGKVRGIPVDTIPGVPGLQCQREGCGIVYKI